MGLDNGTSAVVVGSKKSATVSAIMVGIFERADEIGNAAQAAAEAYDGSPGAVSLLV